MVNILIVDDERVEREALKDILERGIENIAIVGEADHGRKAVQLAAELQPDLILMDIQMPGTDGLAAIREISENDPSVQFIIVSAYDTFDYARTALRMGVKDYLLKPSKTETIIETVGQAIRRIKREKDEQLARSREKQQLQKLLPVVEADFVAQALFDHVHEVHLEEMMQHFGMQSFRKMFVMVLFLTPHTPTEQTRRESERAYLQVKLSFHQCANGWIGAMSGRQIPIIVCSDQKRSYRAQAASVVRSLLNLCSGFDHAFAAFIGVGGEYSTLHELPHSYREAMLASIDLALPSRHCFYEQLSRDGFAGSEAPLDTEQTMLEQLQAGNGEAIQQTVVSFIDRCEASGKPIAETQQRALGMLLFISRMMVEMGVPAATPLFSSQSANYTQLKAEARLAAAQMLKPYMAMKTDMPPDLFQTVKTFIVANSHKHITLEDVAAHVRLSPYYVSKLFKEQSGVNYIDFITECRMKHAQRLMADPDRNVKEIAFEVGYHDPNYFSRVFKRTFRLSPTEYRKSLFPNL